ncbi:hypothetical protein FACS1894179_02830 [Bacteroidia bacterium]|nr:hypothetical protein FACS1894179_02830 [Bacteroidia bacterium]
MKKIITISILLLLFFIKLLGQGNSNYRSDILQQSSDSILRCRIVDSIVNESFWSIDATYMIWYREFYKRTDFTDCTKEKLMSYFNRSLNDIEKQRIINESTKLLKKDVDKIKEEARKNNVTYDSLYSLKLNNLIKNNIKMESLFAKNRVSPVYACLLGWLDYRPAIPVLEAVIKDSLATNKGYAIENKEKLELYCKLALARMGNESYENEIIDKYRTIEMDCSRSGLDFCRPLDNLFYINTRKSINFVIELTKVEKTYKRSHPEIGELPPCSSKSAILLYLSTVIIDYPIKGMFGGKVDFYTFHNPVAWADEEFYSEQIPKLEQWIISNKDAYRINTEKLFMSLGE